MRRDLEQMKREVFDVLVIGGGITGACLAHQLAASGYRIALVEKGDFGGFTSAASSKLLHGGIRYLQELRPGKVRESARERAYFLSVAPHLTRQVPFLLPAYKRSLLRGRLALQTAIRVYERLTAGADRGVADPELHVPRGRYLSRDQVLARAPELARPDLTGAQVLHECQMISSERMTLAFLETAAARGASVANYLRVDRFLSENGRVYGVRVADEANAGEHGASAPTFEIRARSIANAAGPHVPVLNDLLGGLGLARPTTGYSKGVHLVTRPINATYALALVTEKRAEVRVSRGGRHIFVMPWRGRSLIGTTDVPYDGPLDRVRPNETDIDEFLSDINRALPGVDLRRDDVFHAFAGLYPLNARELRSDTYQGHGDYQVLDHAIRDGMDGIVTVLGAKFTTAPRVAELTTEVLRRKLDRTNEDGKAGRGTSPAEESRHAASGVPARAVRDTAPRGRDLHPLVSARYSSLRHYMEEQTRAAAVHGLEPDVAEHLVRHHGTGVEAILERIRKQPETARRVAPDRLVLEVELERAAREEMALTLEDAVFRRTGLGTLGHPGTAALQRAAHAMAHVHAWGEDRIRTEIDRVEARYVYPA